MPKLDGGIIRTASDPYVKARLASSTELLDVIEDSCRSSTIMDNSNPVWNETFVMASTCADPVLVLGVWDWDDGAPEDDDFIGEAVLHLGQFLDGGKVTLSLGLEAHRPMYSSAAVFNIVDRDGVPTGASEVRGTSGSLEVAVSFTSTTIGDTCRLGLRDLSERGVTKFAFGLHTHAVLILDAVLATPNLVYSDIRRLAGKVTQFYAEKMAVLQPAMLDMVVFIPFAGMLWESFVLEVWNRIFVSDQQTNAIVRRVAKREPGRRRRSFFKRLFNSDKKNKYALTAPQFILLTHLFNTMRQRFRNDWGVIDGSSGVLPELLRSGHVDTTAELEAKRDAVEAEAQAGSVDARYFTNASGFKVIHYKTLLWHRSFHYDSYEELLAQARGSEGANATPARAGSKGKQAPAADIFADDSSEEA